MVVIGSVWDRTVEFISDNLPAVVSIALTGVFVPLTIFSSILPLAVTGSSAQQIAISLGLLALGLWIVWGKLAITALALDPLGGRAEAVRIAGSRFLPAAAISLLLFCVAVAAIVLLAAVVALVGTGASGDDAALAVRSIRVSPGPGMWLGFAVLAGLALWLAARLSVILAVIVMERRGIGVFARSFRLTRGSTLPIFGVLILYLIVSLVAQMATRFAFGALFNIAFGDSGSLATIFTSIVVSVVSTAFTLLSTGFVTKLYLALRDARESIVEAR